MEVSVTEQILQKISKFPEILGELSMHKQCVQALFSPFSPVFYISLCCGYCMVVHVHKDIVDELNLKEIAVKFVSVNDERRKHFGNY